MAETRARGPAVDPLPCSGCGKLIDPLRAGQVAIFDLRFHYFCTSHCRFAFLGEPVPQLAPLHPRALRGDEPRASAPSFPELPVASPRPTIAAAPLDEAVRERTTDERPSLDRISIERVSGHRFDPPARPTELDAPIIDAFPPVPLDQSLPEPPVVDDDRALLEPLGQTILDAGGTAIVPFGDESLRHEPEPRDVGALLLVLAIVAGALAVALALAGEATIVIGARIVLAAVSAGMLVGRAATTPREATDPHPAAILTPVLTGLVVAAWALVGVDRSLAAEAASLAGVIATASAVSAWLIESARQRIAAERAWIASVLSVPGRRPIDDPGAETAKEEVWDLRPGEQVQVEPGEIVPVDLTILSGDVEVLPWIGATTPVRRRAGDPVIAGSTVIRGRLRGACTWSGMDRAIARVLLDPRRRADALAPIAHASRALTERWAFAAAAIGALSAFVAGRSPVEIAMVAVAVLAALTTAVTAAITSVHVARGILLALRRGIIYKSADAWDRAGRVTVAVFCARGTLLLGEPELAELEATGSKLDIEGILALAAGAERTEEHPVATAIVRAARSRGVRPDGVRNLSSFPGLGVTAVTSAGEELCVGSRALLLEQRVSIAAAEERIAELEALGRTVVLIAVGSRLVGLIGLQDGLRPGARAAIQHLLDAQIEPVLMSGDARETCEAIGRSLDIDHIRPEILPAHRGAEVRRLIDAGMSVSVLGHASADDAALAAADVSVALGAAGSTPGDFAIALASDDVRDAALSVALAHRTRLEARVGLSLSVVPALLGAGVVAVGLLPPAYAPIASLLGGIVTVVHARALDAKS
ncbi:HAD-IC family P-type ATPase [Chondromyces crocatus]|uniref:P-type Zn(2+) transporter n=1 Tax=Chondromyces crocatus TaxID=52 RepID=A0A0K1E4T5_CHOCO|nr:HAD-IC family P-type ATPase [Chondromyces crocatus]AKT35895.1 cation-translocating P-type ATPase [Chondromyces crocatus]